MYLVLHANTINNLQQKVSSYLTEGWALAGGITTQPYSNNYQGLPCYADTIQFASSNSYTIQYLQAIYYPQSKDLSCL